MSKTVKATELKAGARYLSDSDGAGTSHVVRVTGVAEKRAGGVRGLRGETRLHVSGVREDTGKAVLFVVRAESAVEVLR